MSHKPVLLNEVLDGCRGIESPRWILDCTFGRGGHTRALIDAFPAARVVAIDRDQQAVNFAKSDLAGLVDLGQLQIVHFNFHEIASFPHVPPSGFDIILVDLGVSSPQLDEADRGFSFYSDGPLDMRMDQNQEVTAGDIINGWSEVELIELFRRYGEIPRPQRVVAKLVSDRRVRPFARTRELSGLIERTEGWRQKGHHPATRYFLALRMAVNDELAGLQSCVPGLIRALSERGRLLTISFHSLEDRILKYAFREAGERGFPLVKKVIVPKREEILANPRARSAKLRIFQACTGRPQGES